MLTLQQKKKIIMKETISTLLSKHRISPTKIGHKKTMNNVEFELEQDFLQEEIAMEDAEFEKQQAILQEELAMEDAEFEKQQSILQYKMALENAEFEKQQAILQDKMDMEDAEFEKQQNLLSYMLGKEFSYSLGNDIADDTYLEDLI